MPRINSDNVDKYVSKGSSDGKYSLVEEGYYNAVIEDVSPGSFESKNSGHFFTITPQVRLLNDAGTTLDLDRIVLGPYDPDSDELVARKFGDSERGPVFDSGFYFMIALGYCTQQEEDGKTVPVVTPENIADFLNTLEAGGLKGIVCRVHVQHATWEDSATGETKGPRNQIGKGWYKGNPSGGYYALNEKQLAEGMEEFGWVTEEPAIVFESEADRAYSNEALTAYLESDSLFE